MLLIVAFAQGQRDELASSRKPLDVELLAGLDDGAGDRRADRVSLVGGVDGGRDESGHEKGEDDEEMHILLDDGSNECELVSRRSDYGRLR
jgi:hypothetical protein